MSNAIYVRDRNGHVHIATKQMIERIRAGELVVCPPPGADDRRKDMTAENRRRAAEATMLDAIPKDIVVQAPALSDDAVTALTAQIEASDPSNLRAPRVLTPEEIEAEAQRIAAQNAQADAELAEASRQARDMKAAREAGIPYETPEIKAAREELARQTREADESARIAAAEEAERKAAEARFAEAQRNVGGFPSATAAPGAGFPGGAPNLSFPG